ncbi:hypothetical protein MMC17_006082 [Xylographa soralifera]|nr:hypothetical protein [Xylographa soralifera]
MKAEARAVAAQACGWKRTGRLPELVLGPDEQQLERCNGGGIGRSNVCKRQERQSIRNQALDPNCYTSKAQMSLQQRLSSDMLDITVIRIDTRPHAHRYPATVAKPFSTRHASASQSFFLEPPSSFTAALVPVIKLMPREIGNTAEIMDAALSLCDATAKLRLADGCDGPSPRVPPCRALVPRQPRAIASTPQTVKENPICRWWLAHDPSS